LQPRNQSALFDGTLAENELNEWFYNPSPKPLATKKATPSGTSARDLQDRPRTTTTTEALIDEPERRHRQRIYEPVFSVDEQYTDKTNIPHRAGSPSAVHTPTRRPTRPRVRRPRSAEKYKPLQVGPITCLTDEQPSSTDELQQPTA
jgi:hypothetical protein